MEIIYTLGVFQKTNGKSPFVDWRKILPKADRARIDTRLDRVKLGNFGDTKSVGNGVMELRFTFGSGYRIYYGLPPNSDKLVLLLAGGNKSSQDDDIEKAKAFWLEWRQNNEHD